MKYLVNDDDLEAIYRILSNIEEEIDDKNGSIAYAMHLIEHYTKHEEHNG